MKVLKTSLTLLLGLLLMLPAYTGALAGETQQQLTSESVIETIKKRGKLMVGMSTFVPWAMRNKQGELIGFEIDVAKKVAEDMGVDIEFVPTQWSGIIPALIAGKFDVIIDISGRELIETQKVLSITGFPNYRFLYVSSAGVYADSSVWPLDESSPTDPNSRHIGKVNTENWLKTNGVPFTSFRPTYIYGPGNYNPIENSIRTVWPSEMIKMEELGVSDEQIDFYTEIVNNPMRYVVQQESSSRDIPAECGSFDTYRIYNASDDVLITSTTELSYCVTDN